MSVLVACFRHVEFVKDCLRSILAQQGVSFEVLVRDDGSDDGSAELLQRLAPDLGFRLLPGDGNLGLAGNYNRLFASARGEYVVDFASDDIMPAGRLKAQVDWLDAHPRSPACTGQCRLMDASGSVQSQKTPCFLSGVPEAAFEEIQLGTTELHGATGMIRASCLREIGGWDGKLAIEDFPLWLALSKRFGPIGVLEDVLIHWRQHGGNLHRRYDRVYEATLQALDPYRDHPLHARARSLWRTRWWSAVAGERPWEALRRIGELGSLRGHFLLRTPKPFLAILKRWR